MKTAKLFTGLYAKVIALRYIQIVSLYLYNVVTLYLNGHVLFSYYIIFISSSI